MGEQLHRERTRESQEEIDDVVAKEVDEQTVTTKAAETAELDQLLSEIDGLLEQNAEEFVSKFQQRGGE